MTDISYLEEKDPVERIYSLLDHAERLLKIGFKSPDNDKLHVKLLDDFAAESQWVKRFIDDDFKEMPSIPIALKVDFLKDLHAYILQIRDWMKKSAHAGKIDRWELGALGDIRDGLFGRWGVLTRDYTDGLVAKRLHSEIKGIGLEQGIAKDTPKITEREANVKAREILKNEPNITARELSKRIPCALGLIPKLNAWKAVQGYRGKTKYRKPKTVHFSKKSEAIIGTGEKDEVLKKLIAEQESDDSNDDSRQARVYKKR